MKPNYLTGLPFLAISLFVAILTLHECPSSATELKIMKISQEIYLQNKAHSVMEPQSMISTPDNGFLVMGGESFAKEAWVYKIDSMKKIVWNYFRSKPKLEQEVINGGEVTAQFKGAVVTPEGEIILCGNSGYSNAHPNMFLTRLDKNGKFLSEKYISTKHGSASQVFRINDCIEWEDGIAIVADESHYSPPGDGDPGAVANYLVMAFDKNGNQKWERLIPTLRKNFLPNAESITLISNQESLLISATDEIYTQIVKLDSHGVIKSQRELAGRYLWLHTTVSDASPKLLGSAKNYDAKDYELITIGSDLSSVEVVKGPKPSHFYLRGVFEMPNGSLILLGSEFNFWSSSPSPGIRQVEGSLRTEQRFNPDYSGRWAPAAIWVGCILRNGGFAYATDISLKSKPFLNDSSKQVVVDGASINFVE